MPKQKPPRKPRSETWISWLPEGAPELTEDELLSRQELLDLFAPGESRSTNERFATGKTRRSCPGLSAAGTKARRGRSTRSGMRCSCVTSAD